MTRTLAGLDEAISAARATVLLTRDHPYARPEAAGEVWAALRYAGKVPGGVVPVDVSKHLLEAHRHLAGRGRVEQVVHLLDAAREHLAPCLPSHPETTR